MARLYQGDTINIDDIYQGSTEYKEERDQFALLQGFKYCDLCINWFENENDLNSHVCYEEWTKMKTIKVYHDFSDSGNCREYYRTVLSNQLICNQEESENNFVWYTCIDDNCWNEPLSPINNQKYNIEIVKKQEETNATDHS